MDIIIATSCTGTRSFFKGPSNFSIPSVRLFGVVVKVIREDPMINSTRRMPMEEAIFKPSFVMVSFQSDIRGVPGVKKRLNTTVIISKKIMDFIPFTINRKGTFDNLMQTARKAAATTNPTRFFIKKSDRIKTNVPTSLTLGSSLWITDSV